MGGVDLKPDAITFNWEEGKLTRELKGRRIEEGQKKNKVRDKRPQLFVD